MLVLGDGFASAAFELGDQAKRTECFNPISALFVSSFRIWSVLFFFLRFPHTSPTQPKPKRLQF